MIIALLYNISTASGPDMPICQQDRSHLTIFGMSGFEQDKSLFRMQPYTKARHPSCDGNQRDSHEIRAWADS
jgi:hypothetical protein